MGARVVLLVAAARAQAGAGGRAARGNWPLRHGLPLHGHCGQDLVHHAAARLREALVLLRADHLGEVVRHEVQAHLQAQPADVISRRRLESWNLITKLGHAMRIPPCPTTVRS